MQHRSLGRITQHAPAAPLGVPHIALRVHAGAVGADAFGCGRENASVTEAAAGNIEIEGVVHAHWGVGHIRRATVRAPAQAVGDLKTGEVFYRTGRIGPTVYAVLFVDGLRLALLYHRARPEAPLSVDFAIVKAVVWKVIFWLAQPVALTGLRSVQRKPAVEGGD